MRYKKITLHTLRLSVLTMLIHSGGGVSETTVFDGGGTYELTEQVYSDGIEARNKAQVNNKPGQALSLSSPGTGKAAVQVTGEGTSVMLEGTEKQKITVDTQAAGSSYGLWAIENSTLTAKHMEITLQGANDTAVAVQTGAVDIGNSTLSGTQNQFYGLWAKGKKTEVTGHQLKITSQGADSRLVTSYSANITLKDSTLSSHGKNALGIIALESGRVTGHHLDIKAEEKGARAINAQADSTVDIQSSTLSSHGKNALGIIALESGRVTGHHLDIKAEGQDARAINAQADSTVDIQSSTLSSIGQNAVGIIAFESGRVTGHHLDIKAEGQDARAINAQADSTVDIQSSTLSSHGKNARGILALESARVTGHHLDIKAEEEGARAINAEADSTVDIQNSTLSSIGQNAHSILAFDRAKVTGHHLDIKAEGEGARAINAQADSTVDIQNSTLSSHGDNALGILALRNARVTGNDLDIQVEGQGANAINANQNSTIHLYDSHIQTLDTPSAILASDADATDTTVTITGGSLNAAGDLIVSKGGKTNVVFSKVVISPPGSGHAIHFTGTGGEVDLTLNQTALYGNIVANNNENKANVTLGSGSTWSFTNNATVTNLKNAGQIVFKSPHDTPSFSTLTTDHYEGDSGKILFHARLEGDDSPANKLIINDSSKGTTRVTVRNVGGKGGTTKGGIRLIEAKEGTDGTFVQDGPIVAGSYQYSLRKGTTEDSKNHWYLVSSWFARPESLSYAQNLHAANTMFHMTLHERLGEPQYTQALSEDSPVPGMWIRASGGHHTSSMSDSEGQSHRYVMMLGGDIAQWSSDGLNRYHLGVMGGYGHEYSKAHHRTNEISSQGKVRGYSAGGYATWYQNPKAPSGFYVDTWALYHWLKNDVTGEEGPTESYKSRGVTASVEGGYLFQVGEYVSRSQILHSFWVQPKAQLTWMNVKPEDHTDINGTRVTGRGNYLQTRLGLRAHLLGHSPQDEGKQREFEPFIEANWIYQPKPMTIRMDDKTHEMQGNRHLGEFKMGVDAKLSARLHLWGHVAQQIGTKEYADTRGTIGVKYHFQ